MRVLIYIILVSIIPNTILLGQVKYGRESMKEAWKEYASYNEMPDIALGDSYQYVLNYLLTLENSSMIRSIKEPFVFEMDELNIKNIDDVTKISFKLKNRFIEGVFLFSNDILVFIKMTSPWLNYNNKPPLYEEEIYYISNHYMHSGDYYQKCLQKRFSGDAEANSLFIEYSSFLCLINDFGFCSSCGSIMLIYKNYIPLLKNIEDEGWSTLHRFENAYQYIRLILWKVPELKQSAYRIFFDEIPLKLEIREANKLFYSGDFKAAKLAYQNLLSRNINVDYVNKQLSKLKHTEDIWNKTKLGKAIQGNISFSSIQHLNVSDKNIHAIPKEIEKAINLKSLYLGNNPSLQQFPENFKNLKNLTHLNIGSTGFKILPWDIYRMTSLEYLNLSENPQFFLNFNFLGNDLPNLKSLDLSYCGIMCNLPKSIGSMHNLEKFYLQGNPINQLPNELNNLSKLEIFVDGWHTKENLINSAKYNSLKIREIID